MDATEQLANVHEIIVPDESQEPASDMPVDVSAARTPGLESNLTQKAVKFVITAAAVRIQPFLSSFSFAITGKVRVCTGIHWHVDLRVSLF